MTSVRSQRHSKKVNKIFCKRKQFSCILQYKHNIYFMRSLLASISVEVFSTVRCPAIHTPSPNPSENKCLEYLDFQFLPHSNPVHYEEQPVCAFGENNGYFSNIYLKITSKLYGTNAGFFKAKIGLTYSQQSYYYVSSVNEWQPENFDNLDSLS